MTSHCQEETVIGHDRFTQRNPFLNHENRAGKRLAANVFSQPCPIRTRFELDFLSKTRPDFKQQARRRNRRWARLKAVSGRQDGY